MSEQDRGAEQAPRASTQPVHTGGLMRCCTLTLREIPAATPPVEQAECNYCHYPLAYSNGHWARDWDRM